MPPILIPHGQELLRSDNPFAMVVLAAKRSLESRGDDEKRYVFKVHMLKLLVKVTLDPKFKESRWEVL